MSINEISVLVGIVILAIFVRLLIIHTSYFSRYFSFGPAGDSAVYLMAIQFYRKYDNGVNDDRCLITSKPLMHPNFFEKLVSFLTDNFLIKYSWFPGFMFYSLGVCILFSININLNEPNVLITVSSLILWLVWVDHWSGDPDRIQYFSLQPRYCGAVLSSVQTLVLVSNIDVFYALPINFFLTWALLNTSKFSRQVIFLIFIPFCIFTLHMSYIFCLIFVFITDYLVNGEGLKKQLISQVEFHIYRRNSFAKYGGSDNGLLGSFKNVLYGTCRHFPSYSTFFIIPLILVVADDDRYLADFTVLELEKLKVMMLAILMVVGFTSLRRFAFLGESWRYISFTGLFITPLFLGQFMTDEFTILLVLVAIVVSVTSAMLIWVSGRPLERTQAALLELGCLQDSAIERARWFTVPFSWASVLVGRGFGTAGLSFQLGNVDSRIMQKYFLSYPFLNWNEWVVSGHGISHILVEKKYLDRFMEQGFKPSEHQLIEESDHFMVFRHAD